MIFTIIPGSFAFERALGFCGKERENMNGSMVLASYMFAAVAGICFVSGLVVLSGGKRR